MVEFNSFPSVLSDVKRIKDQPDKTSKLTPEKSKSRTVGLELRHENDKRMIIL